MRQGNEARRRAYDADGYHPHTINDISQGRMLTLSEAAQVTGIAAETITQWEDTEHLFASQRTRTGGRQYSAETVQRLLTIQKLMARGMSMQHIHLTMDELAHAVARARRALPRPPHPLATTQKFLSVLRQFDTEIFGQLVALSRDANSTPNDTLEMIQRELAIVQPTFGAHRLLFWLRLPDGTWPAEESSLSVRQQRIFARHASRAIQLGKVITRALENGQELTIAPVTLDASHHSVLMVVRTAEQSLEKSEQEALEYIAQRLTQFYHAVRCWMNDRREWSFLRKLVNVLPQPIVMRDATGTVVFFNESAEAIAQNAVALREARMHHQPIPTPIWDSVAPDGNLLTDEDIPSLQALSTGEIIRDVPMQIKTAEAKEDTKAILWPGLATAVPLFDADGVKAYSATILQDMTTLKKMERLKDNLLNRVHHQLRNRLTTMRGYSQMDAGLCNQGLASRDLAYCHKMLGQIASHLAVVIEQTYVMDQWAEELRHLEKLVLGKPESCSLTYLVKEGVHQMQRLHPDYHFTLDVDSADTELAGQWVQSDIIFIIDNLLSNAVKYSPPHSTVSVFLSVSTIEGEPAAQMLVRDQGCGIPPDKYNAIFKKGTRLGQRDAAGNVIPGTGAGLSLSFDYAARYRGTISARASKDGPGSEFLARLLLEL